jgi:pimeloyl-ACP methyl ester carboxylesterase
MLQSRTLNRRKNMPAVFIHGVPDTALVWRPLLQKLERRDVVSLSLPGFGNKRPPGFDPNKDSYASWVVDQLKTIDSPIDLVGHDWGALLVTRVVSIAPNLVRSWSVGAAPLDPDYVWHDTAQIWQTPGKGEELMKNFSGEPLATGLSTQGIPIEQARKTARHIDDEMRTCILALYRSAVHVADDWFADLKHVKAPGLVMWGERDPYASAHFGERLASNTNSRFKLIPATGHWYQVERPDLVARELEEFWTKLN